MAQYIRWLLRHRTIAALAIGIGVVVSLAAASRVKVRFQYRDFYDYPGNTLVPVLRQDTDDFGDPAGNVVVLLEAPDVFAPPVLQYIEQLTRALEPDPTFVRIRSLTNAHGIYARGDEISTGGLYREIPPAPEDAGAVREYVLQSPLFLHRLISADARTTAILAEMRTPAVFATVEEQSHAIQVVNDALSRLPPPPGVHTTVTGSPAVETEVTHSLQSDQATLIPGVMLVVLLALMWTFRSAHGVLLVLAAVNVALFWTAGIYSTFDRDVDILASVAPTAILVYGVVDPIFVLTRFLQKLELGFSKEAAIEKAFTELAMPCFLTSLTTAVGFLSFGGAIAPTVRYYGLTVGIGVLLAWVTTVTVLPLLLSIAPLPRLRYSTLQSTRGVNPLIDWAWAKIRARPRAMVAAGLLLTLLGAVAGASERISTGYVNGLPRGAVKADVERMERELCGVVRLIVYLQGEPDVMQTPAALRAMAAVGEAMRREPLVTTSISIADEVADIHQAFSGGDQSARGIPDSESLVAQYVALIDTDDKVDLISADYSKAHMAFLLSDRGNQAVRAVTRDLENAIQSAGFDRLGIRASITGNGVVYYEEMDRIVLDIMKGFIVAFALIVLLEAIAFRSLRLAALTLLPNLVPIAACVAVVRIFDIPLKLDSALVLCISIGGLFNTTIHMIARVRQAMRSDDTDLETALHDSLLKVGPPSLYTAAILSAGFAVLGLSRFPGFQVLGLLTTVTLLTGFASDMVLTSALLKLFFPVSKVALATSAIGERRLGKAS